MDSVALKARELGLALPEEKRAAVLAAVKRRGIEKRGLAGDEEFRAIVRAVARGS